MFASINGVRIYFDIEGAGYVPEGAFMRHRPVCFAIHGGPGSDHADFKPWLTPLAEHMQLVYMDLRCNGQSERVDPATCTLEQLTDDIEELRQHLGLDKITLLGHSFGGMVAQVYATRYPESLDNLVLVCTAPSHEFYPAALKFAERIGTPEQIKVIPELFEGRIEDDEHLVRWWDICYDLYFHTHDEQLMWETGNRPIGSLAVANYTFKHFIPQYDVRPKLPSLEVPTLIVGADYDWITPLSQGEEIHSLIPDSKLVVFHESGHMPFIEEHSDFIQELIDFLIRVPRHEAWKKEREQTVADFQGDLALIALHSITEPKEVEGIAGQWAPLEADQPGLTLTASASDGLTIDGLAIDGTITLEADVTSVRISDSITAVATTQPGSNHLLSIYDAKAEAIQGFKGIDSFPYDRKWVVKGRFVQEDNNRTMAFSHIDDAEGNLRYHQSPGDISFTIEDQAFTFTPFLSSGSLIVVFGDQSNGKSTYGLGRMLVVTPESDGGVTLDFNRSFLPPCAFSPHFNCPFPPAQNRLPFEVNAGEKQVIEE
ncbi:Proline iminopeptidase [compost metagenome]